MRCQPMNRVVAMICLWAFALGQAWMCPSAVWCHDAETGIAHLEVSCGGAVEHCCAGTPVRAEVHGADRCPCMHDGGGCTDVAAVHEAIHVDRAEIGRIADVAAWPVADASALVRQPEPRAAGRGHATVARVPRPGDPLGLIQSVILVV